MRCINMRFENCINTKSLFAKRKGFFVADNNGFGNFFVRRDLCLSCRSIAFVFNQKCGTQPTV